MLGLWQADCLYYHFTTVTCGHYILSRLVQLLVLWVLAELVFSTRHHLGSPGSPVTLALCRPELHWTQKSRHGVSAETSGRRPPLAWPMSWWCLFGGPVSSLPRVKVLISEALKAVTLTAVVKPVLPWSVPMSVFWIKLFNLTPAKSNLASFWFVILLRCFYCSFLFYPIFYTPH